MKHFKRLSIFFVLIFTVFIILVFYEKAPFGVLRNAPSEKTSEPSITEITINAAAITAEIASTRDERARGLSGRKDLAADAGMIFLFEKSGLHAFWMKEMEFPLDIIWIDEDFAIVDIRENVSPETFPQRFIPAGPARYVLEVNAGFVKNNSIILGDRITIAAQEAALD